MCWRPVAAYVPVVHRDWVFHRAMTYRAPADQVVFDSTADAAKLATRPGYSLNGKTAVLRCKPFDAVADVITPGGYGGSPVMPILFLHERTGPDGKTWLVISSMPPDMNGVTVFTVQSPAVLRRSQTLEFRAELGSSLGTQPGPGPSGLRIYAGQADPQDKSRFTIACHRGGTTQTLVGTLLAGGQVSFSTQSGAPLSQPGAMVFVGTIQLDGRRVTGPMVQTAPSKSR